METKVNVSDATSETITVDDVSYACYVFPCRFSPKQMAEDVVATLYTGSGTEDLGTFNIKNASVEADNKTLFESMLNYGAYAQKYFAYDTNNLVADTNVPTVTIPDTYTQISLINY